MINWVLQKNLTKQEVLQEIKCSLNGVDETWEEVNVIPFSTEPPTIKSNSSINIIYGSTTFMLNAYNSKHLRKGLFYDPIKFSMQNYTDQWKGNTLNSDGQLIKFKDIKAIPSKPDKMWFIRPNDDEKGFSGNTLRFDELNKWIDNVSQYELPDINSESKVWMASPKKIDKEWRIFIVDDEIISSSRYMKNGELNINPKDNPEEMIKFVKNRISEYRLDNIYVMDIAETNNTFKIIECNCFNGTGFYKHDIKLIVKSINKLLKRAIE